MISPRNSTIVFFTLLGLLTTRCHGLQGQTKSPFNQKYIVKHKSVLKSECKDEITEQIGSGKTVTKITEYKVGESTFEVKSEVDGEFTHFKKGTEEIDANELAYNRKRFLATAAQEKNKIWITPFKQRWINQSNWKKDREYYIELDLKKNCPGKQCYRHWLQYTQLEIGPATFPFKFRRRTMLESDEQSNFDTELNAMAYGGYTFGWQRFKYIKHEDYKPITFALTLAPIVMGFTKVKLQNGNTIEFREANSDFTTNLKDDPINIGAFSLGSAFFFTFTNFKIGFAVAKDFGIGGNRKLWDYNGKIWYGIGAAVNTAGFKFK